jgi:Zn-dependent peptidase ImmA (M78 family)
LRRGFKALAERNSLAARQALNLTPVAALDPWAFAAHARTRQRSNLMHELAHIQLKHNPSRVEVSKLGLLLLSDYADEQEQEADWHAAALLLPRDGLLQMRASQLSVGQIADYYGVSEALCEWRLRMTGVDVQVRRARGR